MADEVFKILNKEVVKRLQNDGDITLPKKKISVPKDKAWNTKQMSSILLAGLLNGNGIPEISKNLGSVIGNNEAAQIRNARTMVTGAENRGRIDSYKELEDKGVVMKKVWIATPDSRTRESHIAVDGEEVDTDKKFSNGLLYPGDPAGSPNEVWNCRCSLRSHIIGFKKKNGDVTQINYERDKTLHDEQMAKEKKQRIAQGKHIVVDGKNISNSWSRRKDQFAFEIEDVINAQGFDGLPQVVSDKEFEEAVKAANGGKGFVAQRAVNAPDSETMQAYTDQLYNGKWYVDCSRGGATYGQGMYCSADYSGKINRDMQDLMNFYKEKYVQNGVSRIETFTLTPNAKIISYEDLRKIRDNGGLERIRLSNMITDKLEDLGYPSEVFNDISNVALFYTDQKYVGMSDALASSSNLSKNDLKFAKSLAEELKNNTQSSDYEVDNISTYAVLMGYDAINVEGYGETVILNRTKCIFKRS